MRRYWKTFTMVAAVAAIALSIVAVAYGATRSQSTSGDDRGGACGALTGDPEALTAMQDLRADHQKGMQAWFDLYGSDPSSAEAQAALQKQRAEHWNDMQILFKKLGITAPQGAGPGNGAGGCGGDCGGAGYGQGTTQGSGYGGAMMGSGGGAMGGWSY